MPDVNDLLDSVTQGDPAAASKLLPLLYDELRILAAQKLSHEQPGQTLQPTALVHQAYLRLVERPHDAGAEELPWDSRGHFFAAMAEAMRRILVENARRRTRVKHGRGRRRVNVDDQVMPVRLPPDELLALDEALTKLALEDPEAAQVVQLHFFGGCRSNRPPWLSASRARRPTASGDTPGRGSAAPSVARMTHHRPEAVKP